MLLTTYNPSLLKIDGIIRKHLCLLHSDDSHKQLFPANIFSTIFKRNKNLKEILVQSKYPNPKNSRQIALVAVTNVTFEKITWYLTERSNVQSRVRCFTLKVRLTVELLM